MEERYNEMCAENALIKRRSETYRVRFLDLQGRYEDLEQQLADARVAIETLKTSLTTATRERNEFLCAHNARLAELREVQFAAQTARRRSEMLGVVNQKLVQEIVRLNRQLEEEERE